MLSMQNLLFFVLILHPALQFLNDTSAGEGVTPRWTPFGIISLAVVYIGIIYLLSRKRIVLSGLPYFRPFILFLLSALISVVLSISPMTSLRDFAELTTLLFVFLIAANTLGTPTGLKKLVAVLAISCVVPLATALYQIILGTGTETWGIKRVMGTFVHPNGLAFYLLLIIPFLIVLIDSPTSGRRLGTAMKLSVFLLLGVSLIALVSTYTRAAWIGFIIELIVLFLLGQRRIPLFIALIGILAVVTAPSIIMRAKGIYEPQTSSLFWRLDLWEQLLPMALSRPLTGYGIGTSLQLSDFVSAANLPVVPHNDYLRVLLEMGIPGLVIFISCWLAMISFVRRFFQNQQSSSREKKYSLAFLAAIIGFMTVSISDNIFNNSLLLWPLFSLAGCFAALYRGQKLS